MRKSSLTAGLLILLCANVLITAVLSCWYVQSIRTMRDVQKTAAADALSRNFVQSLANEAAEYAKKNPEMENLLKSYKPSQSPIVTNLSKPIAK